MSDGAMVNGEQVFHPTTVRSRWVGVVVAVVVLSSLLPLGMYFYYGIVQSSLSYQVGPAGLTVEMGVGRVHIPAGEVAAVDRLADPAQSRRVAGAFMRGLQMGWFDLDGQRVYRLTTAGRDLVFVDTAPDAAAARAATRYVFNPTNPDRFVALLRAAQAGQWAAAAGTAQEVVFRPAAGPSVLGEPLLLFSIAATVPIAVGFPWLVWSGARGLHYRVGPEGIAVHHLGRTLYRWSSIRRIQRLDGPLPRFFRVYGASLPGYHVGTFTAGPLGSVKLYARRLAPPLVLLETSTGKVVLDPEDVDGFLQAVDKFR